MTYRELQEGVTCIIRGGRGTVQGKWGGEKQGKEEGQGQLTLYQVESLQ